jgi:hypothetical protein
MSLAVILQFTALAVVVVIGVCVVYVIFEMRTLYADHSDKFLRTVSAVEQFQKLQPELVSGLRRMESDGLALQQVAVQIEKAVSALNEAIGSSLAAAAEKHVAAVDDLRGHLTSQEVKLAGLLDGMSENMRALMALSASSASQSHESSQQPDAKGEYVRIRKHILAGDSRLRFSLLKAWVSINTLALLRRAASGWNSARDLTASIPDYLEPDAEIIDGCVLLLGTRGHAKKLAIPIREIAPASDLNRWFDLQIEGPQSLTTPAVLVRGNGHFNVISKGTTGHRVQESAQK